MKNIKKFMKKLLIFVFVTVLLSSCNSDMGGSDRCWIVDKIKSSNIRNSKKATYIIKSFDIEGYEHQGVKFDDEQGKFQIGDTVKLVLNNK